jgi:hypothetical protein
MFYKSNNVNDSAIPFRGFRGWFLGLALFRGGAVKT